MTRKRSRAPHQCASSRGRHAIDRWNKPDTGPVPPTPSVFPINFTSYTFDELEHHTRAVHACVQRKALPRQASTTTLYQRLPLIGSSWVVSLMPRVDPEQRLEMVRWGCVPQREPPMHQQYGAKCAGPHDDGRVVVHRRFSHA